MKGDYVQVLYQVPGGAGVAVEKIQALTDGAEVDLQMPQRNETFVTVEVLNRNNKPMKVAKFTASAVLSIVTGHEELKRKRK